MMFFQKEERYSVSEFLRGTHKTRAISHTPVYGIIGLDMTSQSMLSPSSFNTPYWIVFGVAGVVLASTLIEHILIAHGNERRAEMVESFTKIMLPIAFYGFLVIGLIKIL